MEIPNPLATKVFDYLLRQADAGDTEAEELLDALNELETQPASADADLNEL